MMRRLSTLAALQFIVALVYSQPQSPRSLNAAELGLALKKLTVLGSVLYVAAHPDDDNTAFLGYMAKGRLMRAADLSVTRGEGGQNLIGSEQGDLLGVIRTQELLASRRVDGAQHPRLLHTVPDAFDGSQPKQRGKRRSEAVSHPL